MNLIPTMLSRLSINLPIRSRSTALIQGDKLRVLALRSFSSGGLHTFDLTTSVSSLSSTANDSSGCNNSVISSDNSPSVLKASYKGLVTDKFSVGDAPNGGYLSCMAINASKRFASEVGFGLHSKTYHCISNYFIEFLKL